MTQKPAIGLASYTIGVFESGKPNTLFQLNDFLNGKDLYTVIEKHLDEMAEIKDDEENSKLFRIIKLDKSQPRYLKGILEAGEYGSERAILNRSSRKAKGKLTKDDAGTYPFYFSFYLPEGQKEGKMILQTFRTLGIQGVLMTYLKESFKKEFGDLRLTTRILANTDLMNMIIEKAKVTEVIFIQNEMPTDIANEIYPHKLPPNQKPGKLKVSIKAETGRPFPLKTQLTKMFGGQLKPGQLLRIDSVNPDKVSVKYEINGRTRTLSCGSGIDMLPVLDVTDEVKFGVDGNPLFDELDREASALLSALFKQDKEGKVQ